MHGVGIFIAGDAGRVCGIGLVCITAAKRDGNNALAGVDKGAAAVGRGDVSVIIRVTQPNRLAVQRFGDFKGVCSFSQHRPRRAGSVYIRPVAVVSIGSAALDNDKTTLVALRVIDIIRAASIVTVVYDFISAIRLAFNFVLIVPTRRNVALPDDIPFKNLKFCVALDALLRFAVNFVNRHLDRPFIVLHLVVIAAVGRNRNSLMAA